MERPLKRKLCQNDSTAELWTFNADLPVIGIPPNITGTLLASTLTAFKPEVHGGEFPRPESPRLDELIELTELKNGKETQMRKMAYKASLRLRKKEITQFERFLAKHGHPADKITK